LIRASFHRADSQTDYYSAKGLLRMVDASMPFDRVTSMLVEAIQ
jgi:hypothetical protein